MIACTPVSSVGWITRIAGGETHPNPSPLGPTGSPAMTWNSTFTKPGKPLARRSAKRVVEDREFAKVRAEVMERDGHACRLGGMVGYAFHWCIGPLDPHHVVPVARDKTLRLDPDNLIVLCRKAHDWVHDHPAEAGALGLLKSVAPPSVALGDPK